MPRIVESTLTVVTIVLLPFALSGCGKSETASHKDLVRTPSTKQSQPRRFAAPQDAKPLLAADPQPAQFAATDSQMMSVGNAQPNSVGNALRGVPDAENKHSLQLPKRHRGRSLQAKTIQPQKEATESVVPWARAITRPDRITAAVRQADARTRKGVALARRGATLTARAEFVQALRILAVAMDEARGCTAHRDALARGLSAIEESGDFLDNGARLEGNRTVAETVAGHRTPILRGVDTQRVTATAAFERYLDYAQEQLAAAARSEPVGSMALYGLGRSTAAETQDGDNDVAAMAYYQAALAVDRRNFLAANELGVLLARAGRYQAARRHLVASWEEGRHAATLKNLVAVHRSLGEVQLAQQAERLLVSMKTSRGTLSGSNPAIRWTDAATFAATNQPGPPIARAPAAAAPRRAATSWLPWHTSRQR